MTAQIILMNQLGIALASDSTTTSNVKTMQNVSKIVALPNPHRVAVMIANAVFVGPTHTRLLLTEWIATLKNPMKSLEEYADDFVLWVGKNASQFGLDDLSMLNFTAYNELRDLLGRVTKEIGDVTAALAEPSNFESSVVAIIDAYAKQWFTETPDRDLSGSKLDEIIAAAKFDIAEHQKDFLQALTEQESPSFPTLAAKLDEFIHEALKRFVWNDRLTYLNFAGFGTGEVWPNHVELRIRAVYGGRVRASKHVDSPSSPDQATSWIPIAQKDAMADMLRGLSEERRRDVFGMAVDRIEEIENLSEEAKTKFADRLVESYNNYFNEQFEQPSLNTLEGLNPVTLVQFSELLVKIQSLRSATQQGPVSVGGQIESLSITKEWGTRWVNRIGFGSDSEPGELAFLG